MPTLSRWVSVIAPWQMSVRGLMKLVLALACIFGAISVLNRGERPGERARRAQCANNLKQIAIALDSYRGQYGAHPPAYVADATGRPMHSWRVLLLPFLDAQSLYDQYDFREPWNGPNNSKLLATMPAVFGCPSQPPTRPNRTNYAVITGPGTLFPGTASVEIEDITDGLSETLMVVEVANVNIPWTAPVDLDVRTMSFQINDLKHPGLSSMHIEGAQVALGDARVFWLMEDAPAKTLRAATTIGGGEKIERVEMLRAK
jgi:Protein of unknown function (DUF1559)